MFSEGPGKMVSPCPKARTKEERMISLVLEHYT